MCLYLNIDLDNDSKLLEPKVAEKDIVCYKTINKISPTKVRSLAYQFVYELNKLYEADIFTTAVDLRTSPNIINNGFHSYKNEPTSDFYHVVECIIPKGSLYWEGFGNELRKGSEEYCSNQIIITKIISPISTE